MKRPMHIALILSASILLPLPALSASITNGDFQTGDFSGWSQDVDGLGAPSLGLNDFSIVQPTSGNYAARIEADYYSSSTGAPQDEASYASTLYQTLDLSAAAGESIQLSFDWLFDGEQNPFDENFVVALHDGSGNYYGVDGALGFLLNPLSYGSGTFTALLDSSFYNAPGWSLEFQMNAGVDGFGSFAQIDNIKLANLAPITASVPEPSSLLLLAAGVLGLLRIRKTKANAG